MLSKTVNLRRNHCHELLVLEDNAANCDNQSNYNDRHNTKCFPGCQVQRGNGTVYQRRGSNIPQCQSNILKPACTMAELVKFVWLPFCPEKENVQPFRYVTGPVKESALKKIFNEAFLRLLDNLNNIESRARGVIYCSPDFCINSR